MPRSKSPGGILLVTAFFTLAASFALIPIASASEIGSIVNNEREPDTFQIIHVQDLSKLLANPDSHVHVYDANRPGLRARAGMIPGAQPLTSDDHYDVAKELPASKNAKLIFYCADLH